MDASRLRPLIEAALEAQRVYQAADAARKDADKVVERTRAKLHTEIVALRAALGEQMAIYGDVVIGVPPHNDTIHATPLLKVPVVVPPAEPPTDRAPITPDIIAETALNKPRADPPQAVRGPTVRKKDAPAG